MGDFYIYITIFSETENYYKMSREGALWIGGLEPYMDEEYLTKAFNAMGEENVISIKVLVICLELDGSETYNRILQDFLFLRKITPSERWIQLKKGGSSDKYKTKNHNIPVIVHKSCHVGSFHFHCF